jgi:hypothetical protein
MRQKVTEDPRKKLPFEVFAWDAKKQVGYNKFLGCLRNILKPSEKPILILAYPNYNKKSLKIYCVSPWKLLVSRLSNGRLCNWMIPLKVLFFTYRGAWAVPHCSSGMDSTIVLATRSYGLAAANPTNSTAPGTICKHTQHQIFNSDRHSKHSGWLARNNV